MWMGDGGGSVGLRCEHQLSVWLHPSVLCCSVSAGLHCFFAAKILKGIIQAGHSLSMLWKIHLPLQVFLQLLTAIWMPQIQLTLTQSKIFNPWPQESTYLASDLFTNCCSQLIKVSTHTHLPPSFFCNRSSLLSWPALHSPLSHPPHLLLSSSHLALRWLQTQEAFMEETEIQSIYSNSRPSVVPSQEPAANALPFWAGVLTQRTGHFAQVIKHGSSQGSITGIVQKATDVGSCICGKKIQSKPFR